MFVSRSLAIGKLTVHVSVTDGGGLKALADAVVNVTVLDSVSLALLPSFSQALYQFRVTKNAYIDTQIGSVSATSSLGNLQY